MENEDSKSRGQNRVKFVDSIRNDVKGSQRKNASNKGNDAVKQARE